MKRLLIFFSVFTLCLLCGCTGYREIERGYLVTAVGIASKNKKLNIYIEAVSSSDVADKASERVVLSGEGDDIESAFKALKSQLVKPLYFEQSGAAILDAALSDETHSKILSFLKNIPSINLGIYIVKTNDVQMLFDAQTPSGILGYDIIGLIKLAEKENDIEASNQFYQVERNKSPIPTVNLDDGKLIFNSLGE